MEQRTMTYEEQEEARKERLAEVGTEPSCPFCAVPRVRRSDYIRCLREGINWLDGEDISRDPRHSRTTHTALSRPVTRLGAATVESTSEEK